jgi:trigger factor
MALIEGCKHGIEIVIPAAEVARESERVAKKFMEKVRLPGFRPGKAPLAMVRQRFAQEIRQEVLEALIPRALDARFEADHVRVVGRPEVKDLHYNDGEDVRFSAEFEVAPEFDLLDYRNLEVEYAEPVITEADVEAALEKRRDEKAEYINEDPRPVVDGDHAVLTIESFAGVEGEPVRSNDLMLEVGSADTMPEFSEALRGMSPEESKDVTITYPEQYAHERLAGKTVSFHMTLNMIRRKELPDLNDEFAKDLGDYQTLDDVRQEERSKLFRSAEAAAQEAAKNKLVEKLVDLHPFAVPDAYVDRQIEVNLEETLRGLAAQGIDPRSLNLDWAKLRESRKEPATREVRATLLLDRIASIESIEAMNDEIDRHVHLAARQNREPAAALRARWEKDGVIRNLASRIRTNKTLNFLFESSRKVAPAATSE